MAAPGKGGGRRKTFYTTTCQGEPRHGIKYSSSYIVRTSAPKAMKPSKGAGCPYCRRAKRTA